METHVHTSGIINFKSSLSHAWGIIKAKWTTLLMVVVLEFLATLPFIVVDYFWNMQRDGSVWQYGVRYGFSGETAFYGFFMIVYTIYGAVLSYNVIRIFLDIFYKKDFRYSKIIELPTWQTINYIITNVLVGVLVVLGFIIFIIPGIYFFTRYGFAPLLVADKNMGIMEALARSSAMSEGKKWEIFKYYFKAIFLMIGIFILGLICLLVGVIPALFIIEWLMAFLAIDLYNRLV